MSETDQNISKRRARRKTSLQTISEVNLPETGPFSKQSSFEESKLKKREKFVNLDLAANVSQNPHQKLVSEKYSTSKRRPGRNNDSKKVAVLN